MGSYQDWLVTLADNRKNGTSPGMWFGTATLVLLILVLAAYVDPVAGWFQLEFWPALYAFIPSFVVGLVGGWLDQRGRMSLRMHGATVLVGCGLLQFFCASLIVLSRPPGSFALASLLILTVAFHAYLTRISPRFPFMLAPSVVAVAAAVFLNPDEETLTVMGLVAPVGLIISFLAGHAGLREHYDRRVRDKLKQAVYYQALTDKANEADEVSARLVELLRANHDAGNVLSTIFVHAQLLNDSLQETGDKSDVQTQTGSLRPLLEQLARLKEVIESGHQLADDMPELESARLAEVIRETVRDCEALFPSVRVVVEAPSEAEETQVRVHGGATGLRRVLENLVHNACEGDGSRAASNVRIAVSLDSSDVLIRCVDDGPGFKDEQLETAVEPFATTKPHGQGLGLYSILRLVKASGGALRRSNQHGGGASVEFSLQRA